MLKKSASVLAATRCLDVLAAQASGSSSLDRAWKALNILREMTRQVRFAAACWIIFLVYSSTYQTDQAIR